MATDYLDDLRAKLLAQTNQDWRLTPRQRAIRCQQIDEAIQAARESRGDETTEGILDRFGSGHRIETLTEVVPVRGSLIESVARSRERSKARFIEGSRRRSAVHR
jgi:hypothetical protein